MIEIKLTSTEIMQGALVGVMREVQNLKANRAPAYGAGTANDWQINIEGALGEMALAKYFDKYWAGVGIFRGTDVGQYEVRTTSYANGCLLLHNEDHDDRRYYLLTGGNGTYLIRGWILGENGKREDLWKEDMRHPCFKVPQSELNEL